MAGAHTAPFAASWMTRVRSLLHRIAVVGALPFMRLSARLPADRQHRVALSQGGSYSVNTPVGKEESAHESQVCERVSHTIRSSSIVCSGTSIASPLSRCLNSDSDRSVHAIDSLRRASSSQSPRHAEQSHCRRPGRIRTIAPRPPASRRPTLRWHARASLGANAHRAPAAAALRCTSHQSITANVPLEHCRPHRTHPTAEQRN